MVSVRDLFHQPMSEKIKTRTLRFPAKENPNTRQKIGKGVRGKVERLSYDLEKW